MAPPKAVAGSPARKTILIVEDDLTVAVELQRSLSAAGYRVPGVAATARQALNMAEACRPDLVVIDLHMKGDRDGVEIARTLRRLHGVSVVYLTAPAGVATMEIGRASCRERV